MQSRPRFKLVFMIENFGEWPPEEQARLVEIERRNIEKSNEILRLENERKKQQIEGLEALVAQKRALVERMCVLARELDEENTRIEREVERVLARAT